MSTHDPIAYTYEADTHCPSCTEARFGRCACGFIACPGGSLKCSDPELQAIDREGNLVGAILPWDEWYDTSEPGQKLLVCGTCGGVIEER